MTSLSPIKPVSISGNRVNYTFLFAPPNLGVLSMTSRAFNIVCKRLFPFCLISWSFVESFQAQAPKKKPKKIGYVASGEPPILTHVSVVLALKSWVRRVRPRIGNESTDS